MTRQHHIHLACDIGEKVTAECLHPILENRAEKHAEYQDVQSACSAVNQHLIDDVLRKKRPRKSQKLQKQRQHQYVPQICAVFRDNRHEPAKTEFAGLFFQFKTTREENRLSRPLRQHLRLVSLHRLLRETRIHDIHFPLAYGRDHEATVILHAYENRKDQLAEIRLRQPFISPRLKLHITSRPHERRGIHRTLFQDIGTLQLTVLCGNVVVLRYGDEGCKPCIQLFCHGLSLP